MKCPYCISDINDLAIACPNCARDLFLFKPILEKIDALEREIKNLDDRINDVNHTSPLLNIESQPAATIIKNEENVPTSSFTRFYFAIKLWLMPLGLLLLLHVLIVFVFDFNTFYLRLASIIIPLSFGFIVMAKQYRSLSLWSIAAFALALVAVSGMSVTTHFIDQVPIFPSNLLEWREFIEYAISIWLSYVAGMLFGRMIWRKSTAAASAPPKVAESVAKMLSTSDSSVAKIKEVANKIHGFVNSMAAVAATIAALYTGLKTFFIN